MSVTVAVPLAFLTPLNLVFSVIVVFGWLSASAMVASSIFVLVAVCYFFFSSRRRHTRLVSDWSSDVCSSDLYCQRRVGRGGRMFRLYKFRTMRVAAEGPQVTADGDARVTSVGRFLRRWKLEDRKSGV